MSVVVSALSRSGKAVVRKALAAQEAGKCSTFLSKNEQLEVAKKFACGRTNTTAIVKEALLPHFLEKTTRNLSKNR